MDQPTTSSAHSVHRVLCTSTPPSNAPSFATPSLKAIHKALSELLLAPEKWARRAIIFDALARLWTGRAKKKTSLSDHFEDFVHLPAPNYSLPRRRSCLWMRWCRNFCVSWQPPKNNYKTFPNLERSRFRLDALITWWFFGATFVDENFPLPHVKFRTRTGFFFFCFFCEARQIPNVINSAALWTENPGSVPGQHWEKGHRLRTPECAKIWKLLWRGSFETGPKLWF